MKFHDTLNKKLFDKLTNKTTGESSYVLKRVVSSRLKGIAHAFMDFADIPEDAVKDIRVVGSSASYNYTKYSDLDLHLVIDEDKLHEDCPIVHNYLYAMKNEFNVEHDITIYGIPVEIYTEPVGQPANSNGIWSLDKGWIKEPEQIPPTDNDSAVKAKVDDLAGAIKWVRGMGDGKIAKEVLKRIYDIRKAGLAEGGEFSTENLAFKQLRNKGLLDKLRELTKEDMDRELSLESLSEELDMADINTIIVKLTALRQACKNVHYRCASYQVHLLADKVAEATDGIDDFKEQAFLSHRMFPLTEQEYTVKSIEFMPKVVGIDNERELVISLGGLVDDIRNDLNGFKTEERALNALCDDAAGKLATASALIYLQTRITPGLNESIEKDHKACTETPVDRKEFKQKVPSKDEADKIAHEVIKQSSEHQAMCESAVDRLAKKLGV